MEVAPPRHPMPQFFGYQQKRPARVEVENWYLIYIYRLYIICVHPSSFFLWWYMYHIYIYNIYSWQFMYSCTILVWDEITIWFVAKSHDCNHSSASRCIWGQPWRTKSLVAEWNASWELPQNFLRFNHGGVPNPKHHSTWRDVHLPPKTSGW